jgi:hypothetical protein
VRRVFEEVQVGTADAARQGPHEHFARPGLGIGHGVDDQLLIAHHSSTHAGSSFALDGGHKRPSSPQLVSRAANRATVVAATRRKQSTLGRAENLPSDSPACSP